MKALEIKQKIVFQKLKQDITNSGFSYFIFFSKILTLRESHEDPIFSVIKVLR